MSLQSSGFSNANYLPPVSRPPHDPRKLPINAATGWRIGKSQNINHNESDSLTLARTTESLRCLTESNGSFAGLVLPKHIAFSADCGLILFDKQNALIKKFNPCDCIFESVPFTGGAGSSARQFNQASGIAICGDNLVVADTDNHRLVVYSLLGFLVRGIWTPPNGVLDNLWQPTDVTVSKDRKVLVADPANGCVHLFNFAGQWLRCISNLGAVEAITVDCKNRLYVNSGDGVPVSIFELERDKMIAQFWTLTEFLSSHFAHSFAELPVQSNARGEIDLGVYCARYRQLGAVNDTDVVSMWFDLSGMYLVNPEVTADSYHQQGLLFSQGIDSHLYKCQWDRLSLQTFVPSGTRIKISTFSAETELTTNQLMDLTDSLWRTSQWIYPQKQVMFDWDCLVTSQAGRFLWLKIEMFSDGLSTPILKGIQLDFPRISLRRYLPSVFGEETNAADFTDRFLSIFDRGFRQIESQVDCIAQLFDPLSAPSEPGKSDFLSWLASWIGVTLDRQLPIKTRRNLVKNAGKLFQCRGTLKGLTSMLDLYLGFSKRSCDTVNQSKSNRGNLSTPCEECSNKQPANWQPPQLILEHYKLRRWLFLGVGRLGEQAKIWGQKIVNRSQLNGVGIKGNAQMGVTQLNTRQQPLTDPFNEYAHKFTVFLPAWVSRLDHFEKSISRLVSDEKPAHTQHEINYVEPRFRVGIQSMIGFDSVIGCYPQGVTLGESMLGKASVLSEHNMSDSTLQIGKKSTIGGTTKLK